MAELTFKRTSPADPDFVSLVAQLDRDLAIRDGDDHAFYAQFNKIGSINNAMVCYLDDEAAGSGGFRELDGRAEIKRMYVSPARRRMGIAQAILKELEQWAAALGYKECILETGKNQPEAISLYEKAGYKRIKNYGQYQTIENSVCMQKTLDP
jgi:putative acetyltransferase